MSLTILEKLEWERIKQSLAGFCHTEPGAEVCLDLQPDLDLDQVAARWELILPLRDLFQAGYHLPVGEVPKLLRILHSLKLGQILLADDLRDIYLLLDAIRKVHGFSKLYAEKCATLKLFFSQLMPLDHLWQTIGQTVDSEGKILDTASDELHKIRRRKVSLRKAIEEKIKAMLHQKDIITYLQDDFFTVRQEKYVLPIKLDGRGRVSGTIVDTSDSGQTLFLEPSAISSMNAELQELDVSEKIEIARIFKVVSQMAATEVETLQSNYDSLVELDTLSAMAHLGKALDAGVARLSEDPLIELVAARHPFIVLEETSTGVKAVANDISLPQGGRALVISGPNAGGKTVVLKTTGLVLIMAKAGLLLPVDPRSKIFLFKQIFIEMGDSQNLQAQLSTFSGHIQGLKPIIANADREDLVLLDELAVGTEPQAGAAIAQAVLEELVQKDTTIVTTTHYDNLKSLALQDDRFRNGSMGFSPETHKPTYKLLLDVPGQSYGLEVAEQMGLPKTLIARAHSLRGSEASTLDRAARQLHDAREALEKEQKQLREKRLQAEQEKARWEQERGSLSTSRENLTAQWAEKFRAEVSAMREEFEEQKKHWRLIQKQLLSSGGIDPKVQKALLDGKTDAKEFFTKMQEKTHKIAKNFDIGEKLPGQKIEADDLNLGDRVFVLPLKKEGLVVKRSDSGAEAFEVQIGVISLRVPIQDLRLISPKNQTTKQTVKRPGSAENSTKNSRDNLNQFVPPSPTNSLDVRGVRGEDVLSQVWAFIDKALLRGERAVLVIHGHGTLKKIIREALTTDCPYDVSFRPGESGEGSDGVTIVKLS